MFDVGFSEIVLIMVIALIVVGPERLPKLARTIGRWVGKARTIVSSVRSEVERELRVEELKKSIREQTPTEDFRQLSGELKSFGRDLNDRVGDGHGGSTSSTAGAPGGRPASGEGVSGTGTPGAPPGPAVQTPPPSKSPTE